MALPKLGELLDGRFQILQEIGRGGMGAVFKASDQKNAGKLVAVKFILRDAIKNDDYKRFCCEAGTIAKLGDIRGVARLIMAKLQDHQRPYLVTEFIDGWNLNRFLRDRGPSRHERVQLVAELCQILHKVHQSDVLHRDLKPANILVRKTRTPREAWSPVLVDFGIAVDRGPDDGPGGERGWGTPQFMSPEQFEDVDNLDCRTDVFSMGVVLYWLLSEHLPYPGGCFRAGNSDIRPKPLLIEHVNSRGVRVGVPQELWEIVMKCISLDRTHRYYNCDELQDALGHWLKSCTPPPGPDAGDQPPKMMVLMSTEMVNAAQLEKKSGRVNYVKLIERHDELLHAAISTVADAQIESHTQNGFLISFPTATEAVNVALLFQYLVAREKWGPHPLSVKIGLHLGETMEVAKDMHGHTRVVGWAVHVAEGLRKLAQPGQILMTAMAFESREHVRQHPVVPGGGDLPPIEWVGHGHYFFADTGASMEVFEVYAQGIGIGTPPPGTEGITATPTPGADSVPPWRPAVEKEVPGREGWILKQKLGEGGFGEVWLAEEESTRQRSAFKFCFDAAKLRALKRELRFFREFKTQLGNRSDIAVLYAAGIKRSPFFLESEYCEKGNLLQWCESRGGILSVPLATRLEVIARIADAVAAAHNVGILHRDIKPSNILIFEGDDGSPRPRLADFGAGIWMEPKPRGSESLTSITYTTANHLGGIYQAPELVMGEQSTAQSDIYALGVLLYQIVIGSFRRPLGIGWERGVEDELLRDDITMAVDVDRGQRLQSAGEFAKRLRSLEARWVERRQKIQSVLEEAREREKEAHRSEREQLMEIIRSMETRRDRLVRMTLSTGAGLVLEGDIFGHLLWLAEGLTLEEDGSERSKRLRTAIGITLRAAPFLVEHLNDNVSRANGGAVTLESILALRQQRTVKGWDAAVHSQCTQAEHAEGVEDVLFSPDGSQLLISGADGEVVLWDGGKDFAESPRIRHQRGINQAVFSPDGQRVLTGSSDDTAILWNWQSGEITHLLHDGAVTNVGFSVDGKYFVTAIEEGILQIWETGSATAVSRRIDTHGSLKFAGFHHAQRQVVTVSESGMIQGWDPREAQGTVWSNQLGAAIAHIACSSGGRFLLLAGLDGSALLFNSAAMTSTLIKEPTPITHASFSKDGRLLVTCTLGGTVTIWDTKSGKPLLSPIEHEATVLRADFSSNALLLCTACWDGSARLWDASSGQLLAPWLRHDGRVTCCGFSPSATKLMTAGADGYVRLWDVAMDERPLNDLAMLASIFSRRRIDEKTGVTQPLGEAELQMLFTAMRAKYPEQFSVNPRKLEKTSVAQEHVFD